MAKPVVSCCPNHSGAFQITRQVVADLDWIDNGQIDYSTAAAGFRDPHAARQAMLNSTAGGPGADESKSDKAR